MRSRARLLRLLPWIGTPLLLGGLLVVWKLATLGTKVSPFVLPPPEDVLHAFGTLARRPEVWTVHARATLIEAVSGFAMALSAGVLVGAVLGRVVWLERALRPLLVALQVTPKVALAPLFVVAFGFGMTSKILMAAILAFFPIMLNVLLGVRSVDPGHRDLMRSLAAGRWLTFRTLEFHSALPYVFAGMETGVVFAVIGAIVGEYLGGSEGLGYLVVVNLNALDAPGLFAVIVLLAGLGCVLFGAIGAARRLMIPWHASAWTALR